MDKRSNLLESMNQDFDLSEIPYKVTIESFRHNEF